MLILKKKIPIYFGELVVIFNDDFNESLAKYKIDYDAGGCYGLFICAKINNETKWIILLKNKTTHSTLAHEVVHCTHRILEEIAHTATFETDEPEAYLHAYITREIYKFIKKNNVDII